MNRIALIAIPLVVLACSSGSSDFTPPPGTVTWEVAPNQGDMNSPCGTIVDKEPPPGGKACCVDDSHYQLYFFDGTTADGVCNGNLTGSCHTGTCGGVWNPDTQTWQVYSKL